MAVAPVVLLVLDGVGYNDNPRGNAVLAAHTPHLSHYRSTYPRCLLDASGEAVGLPAGFQGSSEVGHLSMGAGRIIIQELKRINDQLTDGSLWQNPNWKKLITNWRQNQSQLHLLGLLQDEGVHAHQEHLFQIMARARQEYHRGSIVVHPFLDGRDTPPRSTLEYIAALQQRVKAMGSCTIGTFMGRYYGMDRARNWSLTDQAYHCIVDGVGRPAKTIEGAIQNSYDNDHTPTGEEMFDEYIPPHVVNGYQGVKDGDSLLHTNFRQDRAIQFSRAFVDPDYPGHLDRRPQVVYMGLTRYYDEFPNHLLGGLGGGTGSLQQLVGEVISRHGLRQLRLAETQKFRHVTSFFNGKSTTPYPGEDQVEVPSRFDPSSFADHPEMEAYGVTEEFLYRTQDNPYAFILVNFANGDMVGHTGNFDAARKAMEILDECVGNIVARVLKLHGRLLLTADHGNADQMIDYQSSQVRTSHSLNPVECLLISPTGKRHPLKKRGILPDIGPTLLHLLDLPIPREMTAQVLIQ